MILLASLGLLSGQAYWLHNRYQVEEKKLLEEVASALGSALAQKYGEAIPDSTPDGFTFNELPETKSYKQKIDSILTSALREQIMRDQGWSSNDIYINLLEDKPLHALPDSLQKSIIAIPERQVLQRKLTALFMKVMSSFQEDNTSLASFKKSFDQELSAIDLNLSYQLAIWKDSVLVESYPAGIHPAFQAEELLTGYWKGYSGSSINPEIKVYLTRTASVIIIRMGGSLLLSLLLIVLILGCLASLLRVIFRMKKLAAVKNDFINNMTHKAKTIIATAHYADEAL